MVTIRFDQGEIAAIDAAVFHQKNCATCSRPVSCSSKERVCLAGLMHYAKTMRIISAASTRAYSAAAADIKGTP